MTLERCIGKGRELRTAGGASGHNQASYYFFVGGDIAAMRDALQETERILARERACPQDTLTLLRRQIRLIDGTARAAALSAFLLDVDFRSLDSNKLEKHKAELVERIASKGVPQKAAECAVLYISRNFDVFGDAVRLAGDELKINLADPKKRHKPSPRWLAG